MTRRDFALIAGCLRRAMEANELSTLDGRALAARFAANLIGTNSRFDESKFLDAALPEWAKVGGR